MDGFRIAACSLSHLVVQVDFKLLLVLFVKLLLVHCSMFFMHHLLNACMQFLAETVKVFEYLILPSNLCVVLLKLLDGHRNFLDLPQHLELLPLSRLPPIRLLDRFIFLLCHGRFGR